MSCATLLENIFTIVRNNPLFPELQEILYWKDLVRSGILFAIGNLYFFLITAGDYSLLTLFSYIFLALLGASYAYIALNQFKGTKDHALSNLDSVRLIPNKEELAPHVETLAGIIEEVVKFTFTTFSHTDIAHTVRVFLVFLTLSFVGKWCSAEVLLYLVFVFLFVWPRLYIEKKAEIDGAIATVSRLVQKQVGPLIAKLPPQAQHFFKCDKQA